MDMQIQKMCLHELDPNIRAISYSLENITADIIDFKKRYEKLKQKLKLKLKLEYWTPESIDKIDIIR